VKVVLSPYDLTRGRITWRVRSWGITPFSYTLQFLLMSIFSFGPV